MILKKVHPTSSNYPGFEIVKAIYSIKNNNFKDVFVSNKSLDHIQLCPQNMGILSKDIVNELKIHLPNTKFRPHANVRTGNKLEFFDASIDLKSSFAQSYMKRLKRLIKWLGSSGYSWHAGERVSGGLSLIKDKTNYLSDYLGIRVGVEGLYQSPKKYAIDCFLEYEALLGLDCDFALDLSHLQIVCFNEFKNEACQIENAKQLAKELMAAKNCLEIHISDNDFKKDSHRQINTSRWWFNVLNDVSINDDTLVFCESDQRNLKEKSIFKLNGT